MSSNRAYGAAHTHRNGDDHGGNSAACGDSNPRAVGHGDPADTRHDDRNGGHDNGDYHIAGDHNACQRDADRDVRHDRHRGDLPCGLPAVGLCDHPDRRHDDHRGVQHASDRDGPPGRRHGVARHDAQNAFLDDDPLDGAVGGCPPSDVVDDCQLAGVAGGGLPGGVAAGYQPHAVPDADRLGAAVDDCRLAGVAAAYPPDAFADDFRLNGVVDDAHRGGRRDCLYRCASRLCDHRVVPAYSQRPVDWSPQPAIPRIVR